MHDSASHKNVHFKAFKLLFKLHSLADAYEYSVLYLLFVVKLYYGAPCLISADSLSLKPIYNSRIHVNIQITYTA